MKLSEIHLVDATLTFVEPAPDDPPLISDAELRELRALQRRDARVVIAPPVLNRIIESIAIANAHSRPLM
jgi:hypothetical protein